jgi:indolepyruvate ferredoxin oxidoreductase alpha subunit
MALRARRGSSRMRAPTFEFDTEVDGPDAVRFSGPLSKDTIPMRFYSVTLCAIVAVASLGLSGCQSGSKFSMPSMNPSNWAIFKKKPLKSSASLAKAARLEEKAGKLAPPRPPVLCPGCPERNGFYAMNLVERKLKRKLGAFVRPTDIGCYTIGYMPPLSAADINLCMGAGIGSGTGFAQFVDNPVIATIGDSTFFHAGIPPLVNAVTNKADVSLLIFDNAITAMTGHQPSPSLDIEKVVKAIGVEHVRVVDGLDLDGLVEALDGAVRHAGPAVVICRAPCQLLHLRHLKKEGRVPPVFEVDQGTCKRCRLCIGRFGCPAMYWEDEEIHIDGSLCSGCGACASEEVCHLGAIGPREEAAGCAGGCS